MIVFVGEANLIKSVANVVGKRRVFLLEKFICEDKEVY